MSTTDRSRLLVGLLCIAIVALLLTLVFIGADLIVPLVGFAPWPVWTRRGAVAAIVATVAVGACLWIVRQWIRPSAVATLAAINTVLRDEGPQTMASVSVFRDAMPLPAAGLAEMKPVSTSANPPLAGADEQQSSWLKLAEGCVDLLDELERYRPLFGPGKREMATFVGRRLQEVLDHSGVTVIVDDQTFNEERHIPERGSVPVPAGAPITETVSPGFIVGTRVLRRARVRLSARS